MGVLLIGDKPATSNVCNTQSCTECKYSRVSGSISYVYSTNRRFYSFYWDGITISQSVYGTSITSGGYNYYIGQLEDSIHDEDFFETGDAGNIACNYYNYYWYTICRTPV